MSFPYKPCLLRTCALLTLAGVSLIGAPQGHAEVKEALYGKAQGYPFETGWPLRTNPANRVGASDGRGLVALFANKPVWMAASREPTPLVRQQLDFGLIHNPQRLMDRHAILAMMLIKDGKVVSEKYQYGTSETSRFDSQSIAKTFTALVIGVALDRGEIRSLDDQMGDLVPRLKDSPIGAATVRQTLQMQCGHKFKWVDDGVDGSAGQYAAVLFASAEKGGKDLYAYMQTLEATTPGKVFAYDPHCSDSLSMLITQVSAKPLRAYFEDHIWKKLKPFSTGAWLSPMRNPELTTGASSFYATLGDYGLLAQMVINGGSLHGRVIVPESWIQQMTTDTVAVSREENENFMRYGYQTWVRNSGPDSWFAGLGNQGKRFYIDRVTRSAMLIFGLDFEHIKESDLFWEWFRKTPASKL